ncbi:MAG: hypothetical protein KDI12_24995, partial [Anaerolineae bacterium]|nr:hypothetical protein [Anaerolineae bacterium]
MTMQRFVVTAVLLLALLAPGIALDEPAAPPVAAKSQTFSSSMLIVENAGQWPEAARFQVWGSPFGTGMTWLAEDAIWVTIVDQGEEETGRRKGGEPFTLSAHHVFTPTSQSGVNLKLTFPGSNPDVRIEPFDSQETAVNYFLGNDLDRWQPAVPVWGGVRYVDLYPGVDLDIGSSDGGWKWRF